jgi:hypothetical protein
MFQNRFGKVTLVALVALALGFMGTAARACDGNVAQQSYGKGCPTTQQSYPSKCGGSYNCKQYGKGHYTGKKYGNNKVTGFNSGANGGNTSGGNGGNNNNPILTGGNNNR